MKEALEYHVAAQERYGRLFEQLVGLREQAAQSGRQRALRQLEEILQILLETRALIKKVKRAHKENLSTSQEQIEARLHECRELIHDVSEWLSD